MPWRPRITTTKKIAVAFSSLSLITLLWGVCFYHGIVAIHNPDRQRFPVRGIDISAHQQQINWDKVASQKEVDFVIMKATEGEDFRDIRFSENWENAKKTGLARGAYHFFTFCKPGKIQAQNFIATVPVEAQTLPPTVDLEFSGNCSKRPSILELHQELTDYLQEIQKTYWQTPILYVTHEFYDAYLQNKFTTYPIWISNFYTTPNLASQRPWTFWQYSERGKAAGVNGLIDRNVFNGSRQQFKQLLKQS
jgi:lysozyme